MSDIVERLRKAAHSVRWTTEPPESAPAIEPDDAEEAAATIERLTAALNRLADEPFSDVASVRAFVCSVLRRGKDTQEPCI